jgi:signal transduction histidine kinase
VFGLKTENVQLALHEPEMLLALEVAALRVLEDKTDREDVPLTVDTGARLLDLLLSIQKLNKKTGEPPSLIFFVTDVSLRRALEKAESIKLAAEAALKTKTQTISFLCHEIRNPLNGIMCSTAFLVQDMHKLEPLHKELLQSIETCGVALRRIVDDVLDMSKIEQGKVDLIMQPFNLPYTIRQSLIQVRTAVKLSALSFTLHLLYTIRQSLIQVRTAVKL